jgi:glycosyltransferase involved in cell wall biosynthesis
MSETAFSFSHVESPASGATLPQGRHTIRGWVWPKPGGHFVDVRARIGERLFAGVHGLPRADLATHFKTGSPVALAEFYVVVELAPGPTEIVLEVLEIEGRWTVFETLALRVERTDPPVSFALPGGPLRWIDHGHGLRRLLQATARSPERDLANLAEALAQELPYPRVLRDAPAPLLGFVDEPATVCCCRFGRIPAFGHLFHPTLRTRRILGTVDLQSWQPLAIHQPSPGPAAHYVGIQNAQACGFIGLVDVPAQLPNPLSLRIYAELEDGSLHLGPVVRTRLHTDEEEKPVGTVPAALSFERALTAWDEALTARGIAVARDAELDRYLVALRTEHAARSPGRVAPSVAPLADAPWSAEGPRPKRVLLATHGLSLQGAPRFLLDLGRAFAAAGTEMQVVSAEDGPLRSEFAALGARVTIVEARDLMQADSRVAADRALASIVAGAGWSATDLVIANSFTTFWAVHAAKAASRPVLLYVHESTTPGAFYGQRVSPAVVALAEEAFALAGTISFTTAATRRYHLGYGRPERHCLTPGWIDVAALDRWLAGQNREALRRDFGLQPGELLVCNIGTVSDRKGQHTFVRAVDLLWRRHPELAARTRFVLLGGRDSPFDTMLAESLAELGRPNVTVHPETTDYLRYYLAADLFACSSYEESSPRVVLEAMACRTPIIASSVHGVPELVRADREALLLPAGDTVAWCDGLARLLSAPAIGRELAARARARVEENFAATRVLPRHLALASAVATGHFTSIRTQ